ncbi:hypothetical protein EASAB2608_02472 [Streptomyces sp. EAS-AB2608]|uniref:Uncharacterized protein n=1 Tax=Streptomyces bangladeshensis TaxID=295352 RepID=A0ABN3BES2_9ACTN|nr:hypothetical protein EASAB2608_02472 [Streptomyces sp. EAS-AB2608]
MRPRPADPPGAADQQVRGVREAREQEGGEGVEEQLEHEVPPRKVRRSRSSGVAGTYPARGAPGLKGTSVTGPYRNADQKVTSEQA